MATRPQAPIAFIDLQAQRRRIGEPMNAAVLAAIESGAYIMGPPVRQIEAELAAFSGATHCLSCANGTDAIVLPLMGWGIGPGDAVFCPSFTFTATAEVIAWVGASPVFVDVAADTFNIDPARLEQAIEAILAEGKLVPKVVIGVCLFGQPADYPALRAVCDKYGLKLIADSAQGFGGTIHGQHPMAWADAVTTSFFPAKPLGCYGDGGAVFTHDDALQDVMTSIRVHGQATARDVAAARFEHDPKYLNLRVGLNSRLDTVQAAVLIEKLKVFAWEIEARNVVAARYHAGLAGHCIVPSVPPGYVSTWAQYTVRTSAPREGVLARLKDAGVPSAVYYPIPLHQQIAYAQYPRGAGGLPVTEQLAGEVFSLPMHPDLTSDVQDYIIQSVIEAVSAA